MIEKIKDYILKHYDDVLSANAIALAIYIDLVEKDLLENEEIKKTVEETLQYCMDNIDTFYFIFNEKLNGVNNELSLIIIEEKEKNTTISITEFEEFWKNYPSKSQRSDGRSVSVRGGKAKVKSLYRKARKEYSHNDLMLAVNRYKQEQGEPYTYIKNLTTWLNQGDYITYIEMDENEITDQNTPTLGRDIF